MAKIKKTKDGEEIKSTNTSEITPPANNDVVFKSPLLKEPVKREGREYTKLEINGIAPDRVPPPVFKKPSLTINNNGTIDNPETNNVKDGKENKDNNTKTTTTQSNTSTDNQNSIPIEIDSTLKDDKKTERKKAERLADICIMTYAAIYGQIGKWMTIDDETLKIKEKKGLFDSRILYLVIDKQTGRTVKSILDEYNEKVENTCLIDEEFKENVKPVLVNLFIEKRWGLSDNQYLLFEVILDSIKRTTELVGLRKGINGLLLQVSQEYINMQQPPIQQPQNTQQPTKENNDTIKPEPVTNEELENMAKNSFVKNDEIPLANIMPDDTVTTEQIESVVKKENYSENE